MKPILVEYVEPTWYSAKGSFYRVFARLDKIGADDIRSDESQEAAARRLIGEDMLFGDDVQREEYISGAMYALSQGYGITSQENPDMILVVTELRDRTPQTDSFNLFRSIYYDSKTEDTRIEPSLNAFILMRSDWKFVSKKTVAQIMKRITACGCRNPFCAANLMRQYIPMGSQSNAVR